MDNNQLMPRLWEQELELAKPESEVATHLKETRFLVETQKRISNKDKQSLLLTLITQEDCD